MQTGIILDHTAFSSLNYLVISEINKRVKESVEDICIFSQNISSRILEPHCSVIDVSELPMLTDGVLISFDLSSTQSMIRARTPAKKVFFLWDMEWLYHNTDFSLVYSMLTDPHIILIARTDTHAKIIENMTGQKPDAVLEEFNLEKIHAICQ
jgi:hypothetical protein